jgi:hypothetical protein
MDLSLITMNLPVLFYWLVCTTVAVSASGYMAGRAQAVEVIQTDLEAPKWQAAIPLQIEGIPELGRAILLFFGIFAVAYTYQQAWINFRSTPDSQKK